jgi:hypothetical protein
MASAITHFVVGAALALPAMKARAFRGMLPPWAIPLTAGLLAAAPDLDTVAMQTFDIPRGSLFAHRGIFHSACFLTLLASVVAFLVARAAPWRSTAWLAALWSACTNHPSASRHADRWRLRRHAALPLVRSAPVLSLAAHPCIATRDHPILLARRVHPEIGGALRLGGGSVRGRRDRSASAPLVGQKKAGR